MAQQARKCKEYPKSQDECETGLFYAVQPNGHSSMMLKLSVALSVLCTVIMLCCATYVVHIENARYHEVLELKQRCRCAAEDKSSGPSKFLSPEARTQFNRGPVDELAGFRSSKDGRQMVHYEQLEELDSPEVADRHHPTPGSVREKEVGQPIDQVILNHRLHQRIKRGAVQQKRRRRRRTARRRRHPVSLHVQADETKAGRPPSSGSTETMEVRGNNGVFTFSPRGLQYNARIHSDGIYRYWNIASGSNATTGLSYDGSTGKFTIERAGLFLIYAQVTFFNAQERSTCSIYVNNTKFIQCVQSVSYVNSSRSAQANSRLKSCYMLAARYLYRNDKVYLKQEDTNKIFFRKENTFFGFVRLH